MQWLILDFETYYDKLYNLRKIIPPNYILDPRFETNLVAVQEGLNGTPKWIDGPDFANYLKQFDPKQTITITFNALFDNCILAYRYGFIPAMMIDVMGMARALRGHELRSVSLESCAQHEGLGGKIGSVLGRVIGMRRTEIMNDPALWESYWQYAVQDVALTSGLFKIYAKEFPKEEYEVMDLVLRCAVQPRLCIDADMLEKHLADLRQEKEAMLTAAGTTKDEVMSPIGFQNALERLGVCVRTKITPAGNEIPAFAKTDEFMDELANYDDPQVQALVAARLGHKSTLEETRGQRLLDLTKLDWSPTGALGTLPFALRYAGPHTHRLSGDWKLNLQNLPRPALDKDGKDKSKLRKAVVAPVGHEIVVADLGQIEARLTAWVCQQLDLLQQFASGQDPYAILASKIFGFKVDRKVHKVEGHIGKGGVLGLGFGCGPPKFYGMVIRQARGMGIDMDALNKIWTLELAKKSVYAYRNSNRSITAAWDTLDMILESAWAGATAPVKFGPCVIGHGYVRGPNGLEMRYIPDPDGNTRDKGYLYAGVWHKIYGSAFLENIIQFLARILFMQSAVRLAKMGYPFAGQVHDELIFVVPSTDVDNAKKIIYSEMIKQPSWATGLPLKVEVGSGPSYGEAK